MKKITLYALCVLAACSCAKEDQYVIEGEIRGVKQGTLYLKSVADGVDTDLDSMELHKGKRFTLKTKLDAPQMLYLSLDNKAGMMIPVFAEKEHITVSAHIDSLSVAKVASGENQQKFDEFNRMIDGFEKRSNDYYLSSLQNTVHNKPDSAAFYQDRLEKNRKQQLLYILNFTVANGQYDIAPYIAVNYLGGFMLDSFEKAAAAMSEKVAQGVHGRELTDFINRYKATQPGMSAPAFNLRDGEKVFDNARYAGKNLLLVIWEADSEPSTDYLRMLASQYPSLHEKGLEVLSYCVSLDKEKYGYDKYVLQLPWDDVQALKGQRNEIAHRFALGGALPVNVLVNTQGVIVAQDINMMELSEYLDK